MRCTILLLDRIGDQNTPKLCWQIVSVLLEYRACSSDVICMQLLSAKTRMNEKWVRLGVDNVNTDSACVGGWRGGGGGGGGGGQGPK